MHLQEPKQDIPRENGLSPGKALHVSQSSMNGLIML